MKPTVTFDDVPHVQLEPNSAQVRRVPDADHTPATPAEGATVVVEVLEVVVLEVVVLEVDVLEVDVGEPPVDAGTHPATAVAAATATSSIVRNEARRTRPGTQPISTLSPG